MSRRDSGGFDFDAMDDAPAEEMQLAPESEIEVAAAAADDENAAPEMDLADMDAESAAAAAAGALPEADGQTPEDANHPKTIRWYRHWVRPKFLQYRYMYDYRTNYYNDVIEYLDKRAKGINCEPPRAQTWAERVLRTHTNPTVLDYYKKQKKEDKHLIQVIAASIKTHNYHTKAYINQRYSSVL